MLGIHVIIDLSSHLSPVIQSMLLHRPSIVQVPLAPQFMNPPPLPPPPLHRCHCTHCRLVPAGQPPRLACPYWRSLDRLRPRRFSVHVRQQSPSFFFVVPRSSSFFPVCLLLQTLDNMRSPPELSARSYSGKGTFSKTATFCFYRTCPQIPSSLFNHAAATEGMAYIAGSYQVNSNMLHHASVPQIPQHQVGAVSPVKANRHVTNHSLAVARVHEHTCWKGHRGCRGCCCAAYAPR